MAKSSKLTNDPDRLIEDLIAGMLTAHPDHLRVEGRTGRAIVAVNGPRDGKVGIVVGGGSGHEPAFAGYVGRGLADAAPLGNIFASPSPPQIADAGFAADGGAGVLFLYGNYSGDVMNFGMAEEILTALSGCCYRGGRVVRLHAEHRRPFPDQGLPVSPERHRLRCMGLPSVRPEPA